MKSIFLFCVSLLLSLVGIAQERIIKGIVTDSLTQQPLIGVSIQVAGTAKGTATDVNGAFTINVPPGKALLKFSYIGYEIALIAPPAGTQPIQVALTSAAKSLSSVVITGYTQQSKSRTTGAVSSIPAAVTTQAPVGSFDVMLQGRAPGLYVGTPTGQPGEAGRVSIRGLGSINGDVNPLYIVDGVPVANNSFAALNPEDFETIHILKDAASTAPYGSRAANGVIVITTKKGKAWADGKVRVNYRNQFGVSGLNSSKWDMMNTQERLQFEEILQDPNLPGWAYSRNNPNKLVNGEPVPKTAADYAFGNAYLDSLRTINTDWRKHLLRNGRMQSHALNVSGGNEHTTFYLSGAYFNQEGIALNSGMERYSLRANLQNTNGRFKTTLNVGLSTAAVKYIPDEGVAAAGGAAVGGGGITERNPIAALYYALPYESPYGKPGTGKFGANALDAYANSLLKDNQLKGVLSLQETVQLNHGFQLTGTVGMDFQQTIRTNSLQPDSWYGQMVSNGNQGSYEKKMTSRLGLVATGGIRYYKQWGAGHEVEANLLAEANRIKGNGFGFTGFGLTPELPHTPAGITPGTPENNFIPVIAGQTTPDRLLLSQIALFRYSYKEKYTFSASLRRDGSSQVPATNRYRYFYAFGGSWNILAEDFMQHQHTLTTLRLRGSYGLTGNAGGFATDYGFRTLYGPSLYNGSKALVPTTPGNPDYNWEINRISDIGLEFGLFHNRLRGEIDVYNRVTNGLFINSNLSLTTGFATLATNAGKVRNRGIELMLEGDIIRQKALTLTMGVNLAYNKNRILSLGDEAQIFADEATINKAGLPLGSFYAVRWKGVDPQTGAPIYLDKSGNETNTYNADDAVPMKATYDPPLIGGVTVSLTYKRFEVSMLTSFIQGMYRLNYPDLYAHSGDVKYRQYSQSRDMLQIWQRPGDISPYPGAQYPTYFTSKDIRSADYIKLRNVSVAYNIPVSKRMAGFVRHIKVFANGQNLLSIMKWRGFDPEDANDIAQYEYPMPRTISGGINVTF
ncbi:SusC/RagA family TonB-linked outer membrane protein [Chitinophaga nivalis]|uniref:SusC/RagA family TonB-linked outer membrane protein n=1 Tax=Chitinophaga nivalis TaxID=2991709 RepID=A0ABT3IST5_9BACT|nr:SusC/RagA family TonB-linked outer membrane protein [Chitinophaga nivalis]MCW3463520.1 SusC/RagA family TonB-linked outer membrane protein [Chitinophaga nivalis]MCW3486790.1 SusC/RagA family TonB-linked outer membrane protein [Chitinophaga nivalis]